MLDSLDDADALAAPASAVTSPLTSLFKQVLENTKAIVDVLNKGVKVSIVADCGCRPFYNSQPRRSFTRMPTSHGVPSLLHIS